VGNVKGVRVHIALAHREIESLRKRAVGLGRPPKEACELCGLEHNDISRPGWAPYRRKLERPMAAVYGAYFPLDSVEPEKNVLIGRARVPENANGIRALLLRSEHPCRMTLKIGDSKSDDYREIAFEVGPGYARRV
jgi:hypothetical protein